MSRIQSCFTRLRQQRRTALIPFVTAGDPRPEVTVTLMHQMVKAGADMLELGVPFSDPMADGPVIQRASERALRHRVNIPRVLAMVEEFRREDAETPVILMGYLNPVEVMGYEAFAAAAAKAGVDGVITVDMPPEEADEYSGALYRHGLDPVFLIAPTSSDMRLQLISAMGRGFVYYVSLKGVTGVGTFDAEAVERMVVRIRRHTDMPVGVGFGIKDAQSAARLVGVVDAVVVGSALVRCVEEAKEDATALIGMIRDKVSAMREAMDRAKTK